MMEEDKPDEPKTRASGSPARVHGGGRGAGEVGDAAGDGGGTDGRLGRSGAEAAVYKQDVFAAVSEPLAQHGAVFVGFTALGGPGRIKARLGGDVKLTAKEGAIVDDKGLAHVSFDSSWRWDDEARELTVDL